MPIVLRPYQVDALERFRSTVRTMARPRRAILQMETGGGKTACACEMIRLCTEKGMRSVFAARGRELVNQCSRTLTDMGVPHGVMMRGRGWTHDPVQVVSKDTFISWVEKRGMCAAPPADLLVLDECHLCMAETWRKLIARYEEAVTVGLTATPARADGKGLGAVFGAMVQAIPPSELIRGGYLVPTRVFAPYRPDLKGVGTDANGDWVRKQLAAKMDKPQLVGDVVQHWKELAGSRKTIVYGCTVEHAMHLCEEFVKAGVRAGHIDGTTDTDLRDDLIEELANGKLDVLTNVGVLQQGVDIPAAAVCCMVRPTRSLVLYRQACGRIKRPYPGKTEATLIDHSGSVYLHGLPDEDLEWTLDENVKCEALNAKKRKDEGREPAHCPVCHAIVVTPICPECGHKLGRKGKKKETVAGKLVEVSGPPVPPSHQEKQRYWNYCLGVMAHKGRTASVAGVMFKKKFGEWPDSPLYNIPERGRWNIPVAVLFPRFIGEE